MSLLRFHWDFFGPDALRTAGHFLEHVDEFCEKESIGPKKHWIRQDAAKCTAILECDQQHLQIVRDRLRPIRGERVLDE